MTDAKPLTAPSFPRFRKDFSPSEFMERMPPQRMTPTPIDRLDSVVTQMLRNGEISQDAHDKLIDEISLLQFG